MKTEHTPEPWKVSDDENGECIVFADKNNVQGAKGSEFIDCNTSANARRIVACVNACAGVEDPSIYPMAKMLRFADEQRAACFALEKQRDELLVKVAAWEQKAANWMASPEAAQRLDGYRDLAQRLNIAEQQRDELLVALENCRLLAARHRKEEWAGHVLRFCGESGVAGKVMR